MTEVRETLKSHDRHLLLTPIALCGGLDILLLLRGAIATNILTGPRPLRTTTRLA